MILTTLQPDAVFLLSMIFEVLQVVDGDTCSLTFRMRTTYFATALQSTDMILDMPAERILLAKGPRAVFE